MNLKPKRRNQYFSALSSSLAAFTLGNVIGWSSGAERLLLMRGFEKGQTDILAIFALGCAVVQFPTAFLMNKVGCRLCLLIVTVPLACCWIILAFVNEAAVIVLIRFILGFLSGVSCLVVPNFLAEIADKEVRGFITAFFQILLNIGILFSYCLAKMKNLKVLCLPPAAVPLLTFILLLGVKESPIYMYKIGNVEAAKNHLRFYRGKNYNFDEELVEIDRYIHSREQSFWICLKKKSCIKAFSLLVLMHVVQQVCGINAIIFWTENIFFHVGVENIDPSDAAIIVGVVTTVSSGLSSLLVDKLGRKMMWFISLSISSLCLIAIGFYFFFDEKNYDITPSVWWLPILSISVYLVAFNLGAGPLPWIMIGELMPHTVKSGTGCIAITINWLLAFGIGYTFMQLTRAFGYSMIFWTYATLSLLGLLFIEMFLPETMKRSLEEIQTIFDEI